MSPIEDAIVETLRRSGPCCLDDVVAYLPNFSWGEVFVAIDRMSRDGPVVASPTRVLDLSAHTEERGLRRRISGVGSLRGSRSVSIPVTSPQVL